MRFENTRNVGVGTIVPTAKLQVYDETSTTSDVLVRVVSDVTTNENTVFRVDANGDVFNEGGNYTGGADVAEMYDIEKGEDLKPGDVVSISHDTFVRKSSSKYDPKAIGVVSSDPGSVLGYDETKKDKQVPVALAGRVPVKVSGENGKIVIGDELAPSSVSGVAMKATSYGHIVAKALESFDGDSKGDTGKISAFINSSKAFDPNKYAKEDSVTTLEELVDKISSSKISMSDTLKLKDVEIDGLKADDATFSGKLFVVGEANLAKTNIAGSLTVGLLTFDESEASINSLFGPLNLQKISDSDVLVFGGKVKIEKEGKITSKEISTESLLLDKRLAGSSKIEAGKKEVKVESSAVKDDSKILVTLTSDKFVVLAVTDKNEGESFTVSMEDSKDVDVKFDWLVINSED